MPRLLAAKVIPSPETVVLEFPLGGAAAPRTRGRAAKGLRARGGYRVIRTTQTDPYDAPVSAATVANMGLAPAARRPAGDSFRGTARR